VTLLKKHIRNHKIKLSSRLSFLKKSTLHPFLFCIWIVLDAAIAEARSFSLLSFIVALAVVFGVGLAIFLIFFGLTKKYVIAGLITTTILALVYLYSYILASITGILNYVSLGNIARHRFVMPLVVFVGFLLVFFLIKSRKSHHRINYYLNILLLLLIPFVTIQYRGLGANRVTLTGPMNSNAIGQLNRAGKAEEDNKFVEIGYIPDIYLIIFDAYTSSKSLNKYFHFDNYDIERFFSSKGFFIARDSRSPADSTVCSMASLFNMRIYNKNERRMLISEIRNNRITEFLLNKGFELNNFSLFDIAQTKKFYTIFVEDADLIFTIFHRTLIDKIKTDLIDLKTVVKKQQAMFDELKEIPSRQSINPIFNYFHFMLPHPPAMFDSNGKPKDLGSYSIIDGYIEQIKYINKEIPVLIGKILAKSKNPPIIIVMGDHGSRLFATKRKAEDESYTIFNALYLPRNDYKSYLEDMNSLTIMKIIMKQYFMCDFDSR